MRVIQFTDSLGIGGAEMVAKTLAMGLQRLGHDTMVCGVARDGPMRAQLREAGLSASCLNSPEGRGIWLMRRFWEEIRRFRADVVLTHHFRQIVHGLVPARIAGCRLIHIEHDFHFYEGRERLRRWLSAALLGVNSFIVVSPALGEIYASHGRLFSRKMVVIENGVDTELFRPNPGKRSWARGQLGIPDHAVVIGTVARLEPEKNLELLLRAFRLVLQDTEGVALAIVGDGSERGRLEGLAESLGIREKTMFCGARAEVPSFLCGFDIYATTSVKEGLPLSVLEALATELPVVSTAAGELPRVITSDVGYLVPEFSPPAVAAAFKLLVKNPQLRLTLGKSGRRLVEGRFSTEKMIGKYVSLLTSSGRSMRTASAGKG